MAIYRGVGGSGDATNDASNQSVIALAAATAAQTSATNAASSASAANASAISAATSATNASSAASTAAADATAAVDATLQGYVTSAQGSADDAAQSAVDAAASAASIDVSGLMVKSANLSDLTNVVTARSNLGLGSAALSASGDFATAAHNHSGVYEPADATILKDADIGVTLQGYDADTVKKDVANTFTAVQTPQSGTASVSATGTFTFNPSSHGQECVITCTNAATITLAISAGTLVAGTVYRLVFVAGDTSARTLAKGATVLAPGAALPYTSLATTSGSRDHLVLFAKDTNTAEVVGAAQDVR